MLSSAAVLRHGIWQRRSNEPQPGGISRAFLDLDSGRHPSPPQELIKGSFNGEPSKDLLAWAEQEGVDLITVKTKLAGSEKPVYAFKPLGMKVWRIDNARFDNLQNELSYGGKGKLGEPWNGLIAQVDEKTGTFDDTLTASYLFITKEGVCGAIRNSVAVEYRASARYARSPHRWLALQVHLRTQPERRRAGRWPY